MNDCILIKKSELDEIKANHPDKKLIDKIKELEEKLRISNNSLNESKKKVNELLATPEIRIDPMKIELVLFDSDNSDNYNNYSRYGMPRYSSRACRTYPFLSAINIDLHNKLREQIISISKLVGDKCVSDAKDKYTKQRELDDEKIIKNIANMGWRKRISYLKKYK